ncbi:MAG: hypothetical protein RBT63_02495 [Bdellovibrionales bacterium]|jgi:hypothetical protein|nr:hypothetical protein [Bdellovibrionales bacterium]
MKHQQRTLLTLIFLTALVLASVAEAQLFSKPRVKKQQNREAYKAELLQLLHDNKVACKQDSDCSAIALGSLSCGGPREYLVVSQGTQAKISAAIDDLTKTIEEMDRTANAESGGLGICIAIEKPETTCSAGNCVAKQ